MSISIENVFEAIFPDVYTYDQDYNEIKSNQQLDIMKYPYPIRKLVYDNYHKLNDINKSALTIRQMEEVMNNDPDVKFVRDLYRQGEVMDEYGRIVKVFKHPTREDYTYVDMSRKDKEHTTMKYIILYDKSVYNTDKDIYNVNYYLQNEIFPVKCSYDLETLFKVIDYEYIGQTIIKNLYLSKYTRNLNNLFAILIDRFVINAGRGFETFINHLLGDYTTIQTEIINTLMEAYICLLVENKIVEIPLYPPILEYSFNEALNYYNLCINEFNKLAIDFKDERIYKIKTDINNMDAFINNVYQKNQRLKKSEILTDLFEFYGELDANIDEFINYIDYYNDKSEPLRVYTYIITLYPNIEVNRNMVAKLVSLDDGKKSDKFSENLITLLPYCKFDMWTLEYITIEKFISCGELTKLGKAITKNAYKNGKLYNLLSSELFAGDIDGIYCVYFEMLNSLIKDDIDNKTQDNKDAVHDMIFNHLIQEEGYDIMDAPMRTKMWTDNHTIGWKYIKAYKEVPPLHIYTKPTVENIGSLWRMTTSFETPLEMTNSKYYDYMISHDGEKRPKDITAMYSYFSNTAENKLIFISNDDVLDKPAKLRYIIPVKYEDLQEFITEELVTNDICLFTTVSNADWAKIANSNERLDIVAFSDIKNVYKERTPLKQIIEFFKESIEVRFNCQLKHEDI